MKNPITQTIVKALVIIGILAAVIVLVFAYANMFKNLKKTSNQNTQTTTSQPEQATKIIPVPAESFIGIIMTLVTSPDGAITITIDSQKPAGQKTYQLPKNQTATLYTSATQKTTVPVGQLTKGMIVNVVTLTNPQSYVIVGVTDKKFADKLL